VAITPFKAMQYTRDDPITKDSLDTLQSNYQWLYENSPRGRYYEASGLPLDEKTIILAGKARIRKNRKSATERTSVRFGRTFDPRCQPHITTGIISDFQRRIYCVVNGPVGIDYPNANGFDIKATVHFDEEEIKKQNKGKGKNKKKKVKPKIEREFFVAWHAFGFRADDMNDF